MNNEYYIPNTSGERFFSMGKITSLPRYSGLSRRITTNRQNAEQSPAYTTDKANKII